VEPLVHQGWQVAAVVEVCVGERDRVDVGRRHRERFPVPAAQRAKPLEHPGVHQDPGVAAGDEELAAGDGAGSTEEGQRRVLVH